jgi:Sec-independent protein translocase protein TatA
MFGTGLPEIVIILLVVLLLFGPAVLTFYLGYVVGQNRAQSPEIKPEVDDTAAADERPEEGADE